MRPENENPRRRFARAPSLPLPGWYKALDRNQWRGVWSTFGGFTLDAMDVQLYAFVLPTLLGLWRLSGPSAGALAAASLVSGAIGGWLAGSVSDKIGRVRVLQVTIVWLAVSTALCGLATSYGALLFARTVQGVAFGAEWAVGAVFLGEITAPVVRGRVVGAVQSAWALGWAIAASTASLALTFLSPDLGWRAIFFAGLAPAVCLFLLRLDLRDAPAFAEAAGGDRWHDIFKRPLIGTTVRGTLLATGTHSGYWALATWWPAMLRIERRLSVAQGTANLAVLVAGSAIGYHLGGWLSDRAGRRSTIAVFCFGGIASVLVTTLLPLGPGTFLAMSAGVGLFALGLYSSITPLLIELYPIRLRGSGLGFCYNCGRALAGAGPLTVGGSIASLGMGRAIGLYVAAAYKLVLLTAALLPGTRQRTPAAPLPESLTGHHTA